MRTLRAVLPWVAGLCLLLVAGCEVLEWTARNGIPDGYQNEFLHVGNALDLWGALVEGDTWHLRYYLATNYWPPGFYLAPWPLFALIGATHQAMLLTNVLWLGVLLAATWALGRELGGRGGGLIAMGLVALYPGVHGNLVRFEPNVAVTACVTLGAWLLLRTRGFRDRRASLLFGLVCGLGLLTDRLSLALFLALPAAVVWLAGLARDERARRGLNGLLGLGLLVLVAGAWHLEFLTHHLAEVTSQGGVGEIDAAGDWTEQRELGDLETWTWYLATLFDSQAGLVLGGLGVLGLGWAVKRRGGALVPLLVVLTSLGLFTLIQKKQAYYTLPMLGCLAALSGAMLARWGAWRGPALALATLLALHQHGQRFWGEGLPGLSPVFAAQVLPERWVAPRHPLALPPRDLSLPIDALAEALPPGEVLVFSEDQTWFEGFLILQLRERRPEQRVRGLLGDPQGVYEWFDRGQSFVHVESRIGADPWPRRERMEAALEQHHYELSELPPVLEEIEGGREDFALMAWWPLEHGGRVSLWRRVD